jgi:hypothetical protein
MLMTSAKRLAPVLFLVLVFFALPQSALAARTIKVGDGTAASCTEAALRNALILAGGERSSIIQFKCGAKPVVITVAATLTIPDNTTINGNALITLDGNFFPGSLTAGAGTHTVYDSTIPRTLRTRAAAASTTWER